MHNIAIIGAGPAGLICATELEKLGEDVIVIEKSKKIGEMVECAGLFNIDGLKRLGIGKGDYILNEVKGARFISASGNVSEIKGKESKAYVTDRGEFDRFLAKGYDGKIVLGEEVIQVKKTNKAFELTSGELTSGKRKIGAGRTIGAGKVVLATGYDTRLHEKVGLSGPGEFISTSQYEIKGMNVDKDFVELYVGSVAPGFFAWVIPVNEDTARVGLGILDAKESTHYYMENFLKRLKKEGRFKEKNSIIHRSGGLIPMFERGLQIENSSGNTSAYLVGDAAGQVKATTGGGVMIGGLAARALARAIHEGLGYDSLLKEINKELSNHLLIRKVLNKLGDEQYEHMIDFLNKPGIKKMIEEKGDMDFVGPVMEGVMKNPLLMMQAMKFLGKGLMF